MLKANKHNPTRESNLIRLHPKQGGQIIDYGQQRFQGVSVDVFFGLDLNDFSQPYSITRKFNISIAINPNHWSTQAFLSYFTTGALKKTPKCQLHGDEDTGLRASPRLLAGLNPMEFEVGGVCYAYDSIGVACNQGYQPVAPRQGNDFESGSSHFEIKFRRPSDEYSPVEYLCLNIHLMKETNKPLGQTQAIERLKQGISLFYAELGLSGDAKYTPCTPLTTALSVTLDNYADRGFSCKHAASQAVLLNHVEAKKHTRVKTAPVDVPVHAKSNPAVGFFKVELSDFPPLGATYAPKTKADAPRPVF